MLRKAANRTKETLWCKIGDLLALFTPQECANHLTNSGYPSVKPRTALEVEDVVVVTRSADDNVQLHQVVNLTALGAVSGGFWGAFIGLLFLNPFLGAVLGAGEGAVSGGMSDIGIDDDFMRDLGASLKPGSAAVFFLTRKITADKVIVRMARFHAKGHVLQTSLNENIEASLSAALEPADP